MPSSTLGPTLTRRTLLHLLGVPFLSHAAAATSEPDDVHLRLWRQLDAALRRRDQAIANRDQLEATLVQQLGYPRVQLPTEPGTPPHFAEKEVRLEEAVILWNTRYLQLAAADLGFEPDIMRHVAPLGWEHLSLTGDYAWSLEGQLAPGDPRPLQTRTSLLAA